MLHDQDLGKPVFKYNLDHIHNLYSPFYRPGLQDMQHFAKLFKRFVHLSKTLNLRLSQSPEWSKV